MYINLSFTLVLLFLSSAIGTDSSIRGSALKDAERKLKGDSVLDIANENPDFSTLASLLSAAGLDEVLDSEGPFTVFAPTNSAFEKLDNETLTAVSEDPELLEDVLEYHVLIGTKVKSSDLELGMTATTAEGSTIEITSLDPTVMINDVATVTAADIKACNGVIHVIDTVLIPPAESESEE